MLLQSWKKLHLFSCIITVLASGVLTSEEGNNASDKKDFMASHQVLFRRNDGGELLLPALSPYTGALQLSATNANNAVYGAEARQTYVTPQAAPTCLLRTCDQYITGRDLSYQRALEIVQNEEYLVAVDANLIRRRQDYGSNENFGTSWSLPIENTLQQYLATGAGKRKKRLAEENPVEQFHSRKEGKFLFFNGTGATGVSYDWPTIADSYIKYGAATALLFGLGTLLPAPEEPILPVSLSSFSSSKKAENEGQLVDSLSGGYQVYQENPPSRADKIPEDQFMKRFDLFGAFKKPVRSSRPLRKRPGQPPKNKAPLGAAPILDPVTNTKKRQVEKLPAKLTLEDTASLKQKEIEIGDLDNGEMEKNPFLSSSQFKDFFPSWAEKRKKRATVVTEGRIFNITTSGFGTVTYDYRDVIGTYAQYFVTGALILATAAFLTVPSTPIIPLNLPSFGDARINPIGLPPNLPEGLVPPGNPLPGTQGGGARPVGNTPDAREAIALVPVGTIPVAIFPPYTTPRTVPAVSVIFLETATPSLVKRRGIWDSMGSGFDSLARSYNCMKAKYLRRKKRQSSYAGPDCDNYDHLRYGFRTRVAVVENQSCILDVTCTATGDRINVALSKRNGQVKSSFARRQSGEEFQSDAPPQCRAVRDPGNTCLSYLAA